MVCLSTVNVFTVYLLVSNVRLSVSPAARATSAVASTMARLPKASRTEPVPESRLRMGVSFLGFEVFMIGFGTNSR